MAMVALTKPEWDPKPAASSAKTRPIQVSPPRPPYSAGQVIPAQPWSASVACHARPREK